jgi:hypothetical protein
MKPRPTIPRLEVPAGAIDRILAGVFRAVERAEERLRRKPKPPQSVETSAPVEYEAKTA